MRSLDLPVTATKTSLVNSSDDDIGHSKLRPSIIGRITL